MKRSLIFLTLVSLVTPHVLGYGQQNSVYARIAQASIKPGDLLGGPRPTSLEEVLHPSMSDAYKYATTLNLFSAVDMTMPDKKLIENQSWQDLELFPSVFSAIDRTVTVFGRAELGSMLAGEKQITDIKELERRQRVVQTLVQNPSLFHALDKVLEHFKKAEESFLIFFLDQNSARQRILKSFYFYRNPADFTGFAESTGSMADALDASPTALMAKNTLEKTGGVIAIVGFFEALRRVVMSFKRTETAGAQPPREGTEQPEEPRSRAAAVTATLAAGGLAVGAFACKVLINVYSYSKLLEDIIPSPLPLRIVNGFRFQAQATKAVQKDLIDLARACKVMRAASKFLSQKTKIKELMPECDALFAMFENPETNPEEINTLLGLLSTSTFKGNPSIFSHDGRIFAANCLMDRSKEHWVSLFKAVGQLDVYLSLAKLVKEFEHKRVHYSFTNFVQADRPVLALQDFWNPLISPDTVVANTLTLGQGQRSVVITGPNSGGKSVVLKSVALTAHLAQTLGIAPASQVTMTPLSTINTLINVSDAIPAGLSRFRAEVAQAKNLQAKLEAQKPNEFNLVVSDELFSSTSEDQAEELIYEYAKIFAKPNNLCLQATHHPRHMVRLEQEYKEDGVSVFANYKVDIDMVDGKLNRRYKLEPGVSTQKFARKILEETGALPAKDMN